MEKQDQLASSEKIEIGELIYFGDNKPPLEVVADDGHYLRLKQQINVYDRDAEYEEIVSHEDFVLLKGLYEKNSEYASIGPVDRDILFTAREKLIDEIKCKKRLFRGQESEVGYKIQKLEDNGKIIVTIYNMFGAPMHGSETNVYLSVNYLESEFPEDLKKLLKSFREDEIDSQGTDKFSVHFVGFTS